MSENTSNSFGLDEYGYKQTLKRGSLHKFAMFAMSYAFISLLVGATSLTGFGFAEAGPAFWWTWVGLTLGQLTVAFIFAELAAEYPIAGSVYNWARKITSPLVSWMSGYLILWAWMISVAAAALTLEVVLPQMSGVFNLVQDSGLNGFILGSIAVAVSTIINMMRVRVAGWINTIAVVIELVVVAALIIGFFLHAQRGPSVVTETAGAADHFGGLLPLALLVAVAAPAWVLFGFDSAGTLAEESGNPRHEASRAIVRSVVAAGVGGILLILAMLMALPESDVTSLTNVGQGGLPYAIKAVLGDQVGNLALIAIAAATFACVVAIQHASARMIFAMARDNNLPFGAFLSRINKRQSPAEAAVVVGLVAVAFMTLSIASPTVLAVLGASAAVFAYLGYLCVTVPMLRRRFEKRWPIKGSVGQSFFSLGRWGTPINLIAVLWGAGTAFDLAWPWPDIYNPTEPHNWYLLYFGWIFPAIAIGFGIIWFQTFQRHRTGVVAAHRADTNLHDHPSELELVSGENGSQHGTSSKLRRLRRRNPGVGEFWGSLQHRWCLVRGGL